MSYQINRTGAMRREFSTSGPWPEKSSLSAFPDERVVRNIHRPRHKVSPGARKIVDAMAASLKAQARASGLDTIRCIAISLMKKMRLIDERETFLLPEMEVIGGCILPAELNLKDVDALIDRMAAAMTENEFAVNFFEKASAKEDWSDLNNRFVEFGPEELPGFIAYSIVLQNLSEAMFKDIKLLSASMAHWQKIVSDKNLTRHMSIPLRVKYESIMYPANKYNEFVTKGECPEDFARILLPLNIMEAVIFDVCRGKFANAYTGYVLARHGTGGAPNPKTGAGFSTVENGAIATGQDLVESWDDLYQTWNAFFVAAFGTTYLAKLLIPQVSEYHGGDKPEIYAYNRVIALIIHLFLMIFDHFDVEGDSTGETESVFVNKILSEQKKVFEVWGEANYESAALYSQDVKDASI